MIIISEDLFIGKGSHKKCYKHPFDDSKCIKFPYTEEGKKDLEREIKYQYILKWGGKDTSVLPIYFGPEMTNYGVGQVYELIKDYDGAESKMLEYYLEDKILLENNLAFIAEKLIVLRDFLIKNDIITMGLFPENILFQRIDNNNTVVRVINDMGSAALIPLEYYFSYVAKKRIRKRWRRFLQTLLEMYPNDITKVLIKMIA